MVNFWFSFLMFIKQSILFVCLGVVDWCCVFDFIFLLTIYVYVHFIFILFSFHFSFPISVAKAFLFSLFWLSLLFFISVLLLAGPLVALLTDFYVILPYRFVPLIAFFAIAMGVIIFRNTKSSWILLWFLYCCLLRLHSLQGIRLWLNQFS